MSFFFLLIVFVLTYSSFFSLGFSQGLLWGVLPDLARFLRSGGPAVGRPPSMKREISRKPELSQGAVERWVVWGGARLGPLV